LVYVWAFYETCIDELVTTTIGGILTITVVAFLFIPHWTATFIVLPLICVLYIDLLGCMQWAGIKINVVSYISAVMALGLLVDFVMHVLFRYYETSGNREERVREMLQTLGSSVLVGATSTILGTCMLVWSSNIIFITAFYGFVFLVSLGAGHGLIVMPVILMLCGPENGNEGGRPRLPPLRWLHDIFHSV